MTAEQNRNPQVQAASSYGAVDLSASAAPEPEPAGAAATQPATDSAASTAGSMLPATVGVTMENFEEVVKQSTSVPVLLLVTTPEAEDATGMSQQLRTLIDADFPTRFLLGICNGQEQLQIAQALQVQGVPTVVGLVNGRPVPLFTGPQPVEQIKSILGELLDVAAKMGVNGTVSGSGVAAPPPPATHVAAQEAEDGGDWDLAITKWEQAIEEDPSDRTARHRLAQAKLAKRRAEEGEGNDDDPRSLADSFALAGNYAAAFEVLLKEVASHFGDEREPFRQQLVDLFEVAGDDPAVGPARSRLASILF